MPAKNKNQRVSKVKNVTKKIDQVDLIDQALGECSGLQNWIADVLAEVKIIKDSTEKSESVQLESLKSSAEPNLMQSTNKQQQTNKNGNGNKKNTFSAKSSISLTNAANNNNNKMKSASFVKSLPPPSSPSLPPTAAAAAAANKLNKKPSAAKKSPTTSPNKNHHKKKVLKKSTKGVKKTLAIDSDNGGSSGSGSLSIKSLTTADFEEMETSSPLLDGEALSLIGRSSQECLASYSKVNKRYLEVKRSMDSLMVDLNRVGSIMNRQHNIFHGGLLTTSDKTQVCHH